MPRAAYVHVPFCLHKCGYCDFTVLAGHDDLADSYLEAISRELATLGQPHEVDTLFIGGGTPTHLTVPQLKQLTALLRRWLPLAPGGEWSIEANPYELVARDDGRDLLDALRAAGLTRVSLGVQSVDAAVLKTLERTHSPGQVHEAISRVGDRFATWSVDLIFGVPGQTLASWEQTLDEVIARQPPHVSAYGLTFEKGTAFWSRLHHGDLVRTPDETERAMQAAAMDRLPAAGLRQYELSNFARPGHRCRHNETYWAAGDFFGFGPGAASLVDGVRRTNHRSARTYLKRILSGESPVMETEPLSTDTIARERIMLGLRRIDGLPLDGFERVVGRSLDDFAPGVSEKMQARGWVTVDTERLTLTREGRFVADEVIAAFF